jgi:undecaprenyl-diphosphatase
MIERLLHIISILGHWGYLIIFIAAFLESSAFMGLLVPGESVVALSGFLASQGYLEIGDLLWVVSLGAVLGDSVGYGLGKAIGRGYFERHKRLLFLKEKHLRRVDAYFQQHGGKIVFFGRFVGFLRAMAPFAAGMLRDL